MSVVGLRSFHAKGTREGQKTDSRSVHFGLLHLKCRQEREPLLLRERQQEREHYGGSNQLSD
jgi:hypothetical protein